MVLGSATALPDTLEPFASVPSARQTLAGSVGLAWVQNPDPDSSASVRWGGVGHSVKMVRFFGARRTHTLIDSTDLTELVMMW